MNKNDQNNIKKGLLVVSFGSSHQDTLKNSIFALEDKIAQAFPEYEFRRAFGSKIIIRILKERDHFQIDTLEEAMDKFQNEGFKEIMIQPTYMIQGIEYDILMDTICKYEKEFESIKVGKPLLNREEDYDVLVKGLSSFYPYDEACGIIFMGHGTEHFSNACYPCLEHKLHSAGLDRSFVGTVEGYPDLSNIIGKIKEKKLKKIILMPLLIVAGEHAKNDMAGEDEKSWKNQLKEIGIEVECILRGLGSYEFIQDMFVRHAKNADEQS